MVKTVNSSLSSLEEIQRETAEALLEGSSLKNRMKHLFQGLLEWAEFFWGWRFAFQAPSSFTDSFREKEIKPVGHDSIGISCLAKRPNFSDF